MNCNRTIMHISVIQRAAKQALLVKDKPLNKATFFFTYLLLSEQERNTSYGGEYDLSNEKVNIEKQTRIT